MTDPRGTKSTVSEKRFWFDFAVWRFRCSTLHGGFYLIVTILFYFIFQKKGLLLTKIEKKNYVIIVKVYLRSVYNKTEMSFGEVDGTYKFYNMCL